MNRIGPIQLFAEIKSRDDRATYRGFDTASGQVVLVKIFKPATLPDEKTVGRFQEEAAIYASLNHPNVVRLVKYGVAENRPFLALEFIEGQNLRSLLARRSLLPDDVATSIALAIFAGLEEIHRHRIIHRDLKPENIMLGNDGSVKICDFDLAITRHKEQIASPSHFKNIQGKAGQATTDNRQLTTDHLLSGSPGYFAPEAILGEIVSARADLFAAGVILYEMFAGTRPFAAPTASGEMNAVVRLPHLSPAKFNSAISEEMEKLINQLLAKSPSERPASAAEIRNRLTTRFQIPAATTPSEKLQSFLRDPQSYQGENLSMAISPVIKPTAQRARPGWRIAAVLMLLALIFGYQMFLKKSASPTNGHATLPVQPAAKEPASMSRADSILRVLNRIDALDDSPERPAGFKIEDVKKTAPPPTPTVEIKSTPAQPFLKRVTVRNVPWAYLFVNGDSIGQMPRSEPLTLAAGVYPFVFKKPQFPPITFKVVVDSTTADTLTFSLLERVAQVEVKIYPWAEIYVDGARRELSAENPAIYLLPGKHHFRFVHLQGEKNETLALQAGEVRRLEVNMFQGTKRE